MKTQGIELIARAGITHISETIERDLKVIDYYKDDPKHIYISYAIHDFDLVALDSDKRLLTKARVCAEVLIQEIYRQFPKKNFIFEKWNPDGVGQWVCIEAGNIFVRLSWYHDPYKLSTIITYDCLIRGE